MQWKIKGPTSKSRSPGIMELKSAFLFFPPFSLPSPNIDQLEWKI